MRKGLWIAAGIVLLGANLAMAQDQAPRRDADKPNTDRPNPGRPNTGRPDAGRPDTGRPGTGRPDAGRPGTGRPDAGRPGAPNPRPPAHRPPARPPVAGRPPHFGPRPPHRYFGGGGWRHSIRGPAFRFPPGFAYRSWVTGAILPSIFLTAPYFYDDYAPLGLGPPPAGYRWVRYGPDLLLVNVISGRIADVVDGVFY
jgi:Ni/Co efflux regulator RcnB